MKILDNNTEATAPGQMKISKKKFLDYWGIKGLKRFRYLIQLSSSPDQLLNQYGSDEVVVDFVTKSEQFQYGCLNPTIVLNKEQGLIATLTDLSLSADGSKPAIKISQEPLHLIRQIEIHNGQQLPSVAIYHRDPENYQATAWEDFEPKLAYHFSNDTDACNNLLARVPEQEWQDLEEGLNQIDNLEKPGLYHIQLQNTTTEYSSNDLFDQYRAELNELRLTTIEDLENLLQPLIQNATKIDVQPASKPPGQSHLRSHFGGQPYFEEGEQWPVSRTGNPLDFIFQIVNQPELELPQEIALIQFYFDWENPPWHSSDDGWLVKTYQSVNRDQMVLIEKPDELQPSNYCEVKFESVKSLPAWEGIERFNVNASKLSCVLNEDEPWANYDSVVEKLTGQRDYQSQLGGYPKWVQGDGTPKRQTDQSPMKLLFQIDSEVNANIMWGDVGLIYVFYDGETAQMEFQLQCH